MTCHGEWFKDVKDLKTLGYVEIPYYTSHCTNWQGELLFVQDGQTKYLKDLFQVDLRKK
jgi:hypothetical protein